MLRWSKVLTGLLLLGPAMFLIGQKTDQTGQPRYPNELPNLQFYENAKWKSLAPLVSSISDVRRILGEPSDAKDLSHYSAPYPGDDKAEAPVFTYAMDAEWEILVYFVKDCGYRFSPSDIPGDRLCTFELIPKKHLSFLSTAFPQ